jgi:hypothetical protein
VRVVWVWVVGVVVLVVAGFWVAFVPARRVRGVSVRSAWSVARAAIGSAVVSRDACGCEVVEAEELLARAELLVAARGGVVAAAEAADCAARADRLWRAAAGG